MDTRGRTERGGRGREQGRNAVRERIQTRDIDRKGNRRGTRHRRKMEGTLGGEGGRVEGNMGEVEIK